MESTLGFNLFFFLRSQYKTSCKLFTIYKRMVNNNDRTIYLFYHYFTVGIHSKMVYK